VVGDAQHEVRVGRPMIVQIDTPEAVDGVVDDAELGVCSPAPRQATLLTKPVERRSSVRQLLRQVHRGAPALGQVSLRHEPSGGIGVGEGVGGDVNVHAAARGRHQGVEQGLRLALVDDRERDDAHASLGVVDAARRIGDVILRKEQVGLLQEAMVPDTHGPGARLGRRDQLRNGHATTVTVDVADEPPIHTTSLDIQPRFTSRPG